MSAIQDMRQGLSGALRAAGLTKVFDGWAPANSTQDSISVVPQSTDYLTYTSFGEGYTLHMEILIVAKPYSDPTTAWNYLDETLEAVLAATVDWDNPTVTSPALVLGTENLSVTVRLSHFVKLDQHA